MIHYKTKEEIEIMRHSCLLVGKTHAVIAAQLKPGITTMEVNKLAETMANMPTLALGLTKRLLNKSLTNSLEEQLAMESKLQIQAAESHDYNEGVTAFVEKRKPEFRGN